MQVLFYGKLADRLGEAIELPVSGPCTLGELRQRLAEEHPAAGVLDGRVRACVGDRFVGETDKVGPDDVVEFLAPVSGG